MPLSVNPVSFSSKHIDFTSTNNVIKDVKTIGGSLLHSNLNGAEKMPERAETAIMQLKKWLEKFHGIPEGLEGDSFHKAIQWSQELIERSQR